MIGFKLPSHENTGVARGCSGCTCTPGRRKKLGVRFVCAPQHTKCVHDEALYNYTFTLPYLTKCTPRQSKSQFLGHFLLGGGDLKVGVVHFVVLDCLLRATTKRKPIAYQLEARKISHRKHGALRRCSSPFAVLSVGES